MTNWFKDLSEELARRNRIELERAGFKPEPVKVPDVFVRAFEAK